MTIKKWRQVNKTMKVMMERQRNINYKETQKERGKILRNS